MGLKKFIRNLRYLWKSSDLEKLEGNRKLTSQMESCVKPLLAYADYLYRREPVDVVEKPRIMSAEETLLEVTRTHKSMARFGDGEILLICGESIPFQRSSERLSKRLSEILSSDDDNMMLNILSAFYNPIPSCEIYCRMNDYGFLTYPFLRCVVHERIKKNKTYYETGLATIRTPLERYEQWRKIWAGKDIAVICGDRVFSKLKYNIFDNAGSIEYLYVPTMDAFEEYDGILSKASRISKEKLVFILAGPTATVLAYDMSKNAYRALDVGHLAKAYDVVKRNLTEDHEMVRSFYAPD